VESGERPVVGVNKFVSEEPPPDIDTYELDAEGRELQLKRLSKVKAERDTVAVAASLAALSRAAEGDDNLMHKLIDCASAYCTVGAQKAADAGDIADVVRGTIPQADVPKLLEAGAAAVFPTGTPLDVLVQEVRKLTSEKVD